MYYQMPHNCSNSDDIEQKEQIAKNSWQVMLLLINNNNYNHTIPWDSWLTLLIMTQPFKYSAVCFY